MKGAGFMNTAKISETGQITVPPAVRRKLRLKAGDEMLFYTNESGQIVVSNSAAATIRKAQDSFSAARDALGVQSEEDVRRLVDELRGEDRA